MIGRPACSCRINAFKAQLAEVKFIYENVNDPNRVRISNLVVEKLRQQRALRAAFALNETLHSKAPSPNMNESYQDGPFDTLWAVTSIGHATFYSIDCRGGCCR